MSRHLFLEGDRGCGKSTILLRELGHILGDAGGYGTVRLLDSEGKICGFCQKPASRMEQVDGDYDPECPGIFLEKKNGVMQCYEDVFLTQTLPLLDSRKSCRFFLLDELGGVELLLPAWRERIHELLSGSLPCVGVWKSEANSRHLREGAGYSEAFAEEYDSMRCFLRENREVTLLPVTAGSREEAGQAVRDWAAENNLFR